jgi:hypothetical protein
MSTQWLWRFAVIAISGVAATAVSANGYCVACSGPDATYRCTVRGMPEGMPADPVSQIACVKQLATAGGHERCSIEKFSQENCNGPEKVVAGSTVTLPAAGDPPWTAPKTAEPPTTTDAGKAPVAKDQAKAIAQPPDAATKTTEAAGEPPPRTVEELTKNSVAATQENLGKAGEAVSDTAKKTGQQIENAGSAIGNAAKKSWTCLASLFSDC